MLSCNCKHEINILNLENNELINHQYILIKGLIRPSTNCVKPIELQCENLPTFNILKAHGHVNDNRFKFLIDLGFIDQIIKFTFNYCNSTTSITINYKLTSKQFKVCPLLILGCDEKENHTVNSYCKKIDVNLRLLQSVYADKLRESVNKRETFQLMKKCSIFRTRLTRTEIWESNPNNLWQNFAQELIESQWSNDDRLKFVAFINCTKYEGDKIIDTSNLSYESTKQYIKGHAALGGGGLALFGSIYFYCWPNKFQEILKCFHNTAKVDLRKHPDESNYRKTWGTVYASTLGAMCHELGHIFDLGHTKTGIMGTGFDFINRVFTLNSSTEHLPKRLIKQADMLVPLQSTQGRNNITKFKKPADGFLDDFRMQRKNDGFYFMKNSAITLAHHPWLRENILPHFQNNDFKISYNVEGNFIESENISLKLIEIRSEDDGLTIQWYELQKSTEDIPVFKYTLPQAVKSLCKDKHYIFVLSSQGHIKRLTLKK